MKKLLIILLFFFQLVKGQTISTYVGTGTLSYGIVGDGGPATAANIGQPKGVNFDNNGNLLVSMYNSVRKVDSVSHIISLIAGNDTGTSTGDGRPATCAFFNPVSTVVDITGNYYIGDGIHYAVRRVDATTRIVNAYAGDESAGAIGDGGLATAAEFQDVLMISIDTVRRNLYIPDGMNYKVRKVNMSTGILTTIAGTGTDGDMAEGIPATVAQIGYIIGICLDHAGNIYLGDIEYGKIRKINITTGIISTIVGNGSLGFGGDGGPATAAMLNNPRGICFDNCGNLIISDFTNNRVRQYDTTTQIISTIVGSGALGYFGDGGPATAAKLNQPQGVIVDASNHLYIADWGNNVVRKVNLCGSVETDEVIVVTKEIEIFPNPAKNQLTISCGEIINSIEVYNVMGSSFDNLRMTKLDNNSKIEINIGDLAKGIYIIRVNGSIVRRFIKE